MSTNRADERARNTAPVERWVSRPAGTDEAEDRFASLIRAAEPPAGLGPVAQARVWARLRRRPTSRARLTRLRWGVALALLLTSGVVLGALSVRRWLPATRATIAPASAPAKPRVARSAHVSRPEPASQAERLLQPAPPMDAPPPGAAPIPETDPPPPPSVRASAAPHAAPTRGRIVATSQPEHAAPVAPTATSAPAGDTRVLGEAHTPQRQQNDARSPLATLDAPVAEVAPPAPPVRAIAAPPASPTPGRIAATSQAPPAAAAAAPAAPPATSALAGETPLLGEALTRLRQQHDARGALATLDQYRARYPNGTLKREAEGARIDALLLLGRNAEALTELRALTLRPAGRDQELRVIRGELSAASDCGRAVVDFDQVLAEQAPAPFVERALHGRAACRLRLGNEAGAIHDLSEYLQRFPQGRFAAEARRTLEGRRGNL